MGDRGGEAIAEERRAWSISSGGATEREFGWSHPQARVESHSDGQSGALPSFQACIQPLHGVEHPQPRPYRPLGIILVGQGPPLRDEQGVAEPLGAMAVNTLDNLHTRLLVGTHDLAQVLRV